MKASDLRARLDTLAAQAATAFGTEATGHANAFFLERNAERAPAWQLWVGVRIVPQLSFSAHFEHDCLEEAVVLAEQRLSIEVQEFKDIVARVLGSWVGADLAKKS